MNCPRCNKPTLDEHVRQGVTIDVCRECRGIWLDRGELELILARAGDEYTAPIGQYRQDQHRGHHDDHHDERHDERHHGHGDKHHGRRKHWLAELLD